MFNNERDKMIRYIAVEKATPDIPRVWGDGKTDLVARLQCEIALREKLVGKLERGCQEAFAQTHLYVIKQDKTGKYIGKEDKHEKK
jgi:hypothetical protein